jgi:capsular polysaccharide export protein
VNKIGTIKETNILLLQGPMGYFFRNLDILFSSHGATTFRIGFNLGDWFFSRKDNYIPYNRPFEEWADFIEDFFNDKSIDKVFLFGDCRIYQRVAIKIAQKLNIETYVFEEGYVRPNYITLEKWGVNNFSMISRDKEFYEKLSFDDYHHFKDNPTNPSFMKMAVSASVYYLLAYFGRFKYPYYKHHRELHPLKEFLYGLRNVYRKYLYKLLEYKKQNDIIKKKFFFVPLQTYNDFQLKTHSSFSTIEEFIKLVIASFANAKLDKDIYLVIKHHPMDRGRKNYKRYIDKVAQSLDIKQQVIVVYDLHLPTLLSHTLGTVTINSTVGLQALYHNSPVKVMGNAIYDIESLCDKKSLEYFWINPIKPDHELFEKFRGYLINNTQINCSFYGDKITNMELFQ